uniref:Longitudinals lacking protein, isoforms A/B/D/L n=1 Tax=Schizaphis graminum TaxID=13262 RepID=A0A2S2P0I6_SCHGA
MFNGHEYICNKCGKMYMHRGSLQRHSKFECGVTPKFGCSFCGRRFSQRSNLSRHVVDIHRSALEEFINKRSVFCFIFYKNYFLMLHFINVSFLCIYRNPEMKVI